MSPANSSSTTPPATVLELFRAVPPNAPALHYFDRTLDHAEIDARSNALAAAWRAQGVQRGDRVGIVLQNTPQFVIGALAAWKLAAIAVLLNPMYRRPELARLFADCRPAALLCHDDQWHEVVAAAEDVLPANRVLWTSPREGQRREDARVLPPVPAQPPPAQAQAALAEASAPDTPGPQADDVAVLMYTSGTTGVPKGAMLTHRNLVGNARACVAHFGLDGNSRIFALAPMFHVTGLEVQMVTAFAAGASQVLGYRFHPELALESFVEHRPTFIIGAITAFIALMNQPEARAAHFASFEHLYSGGAPIAPAVVRAFAQRFGRSIRSSYGMTELSAPSHLAPVDGEIPVDPQSGALSIGLPLPGIDALIVDEQGRELPPGQHGELLVRGPTVMAGYWRKPEESAQVLAGGWMHTGDVGFRDAAGWFYLVDRKKDMICASGFKVWPREVEDVLYAFPGVREAAVVGAPDPYRGETVVAYVSATAQAGLDPLALQRHCRDRLAAYKCPVAIHVLEDLPKTESGKITRAVLARRLR
jgi:long-chain acyl-CoA synthetase